MLDKARANADDQGHYTLPIEAEILQLRIEALGGMIDGQLLRRAFLGLVHVQRPFSILSGSGRILKGAVIAENTLLFYQEVAGSHFIQIKMTKRDDQTLLRQWQKDPMGSGLQLLDRAGHIITIPFARIQVNLGSDNPDYPRETANISLNGEQANNKAVGYLKTHTLNIVTDDPRIDSTKDLSVCGHRR